MKRLLLSTVFATMILGAVVPPIELTPHDGTLEDPWPVYQSDTVSLAWNAVPYDNVGSKIVAADIQLYDSGGELVEDFNARQGAVLRVGPDYRVHVRALFLNRENGVYQMCCRVYDEHGNVSEWSDRVFALKQWQALPSPGCWLTI